MDHGRIVFVFNRFHVAIVCDDGASGHLGDTGADVQVQSFDSC